MSGILLKDLHCVKATITFASSKAIDKLGLIHYTDELL